MTSAATIVLARGDLSSPGGTTAIDLPTTEARFFALLREAKPDVILLDLTGSSGTGLEAIRTIRNRCRVPIVVVCDVNDQHLFEYRVAGATECIPAPVDLCRLNQTLEQIKTYAGEDKTRILSKLESLYFVGLEFRAYQKLVVGPAGSGVKLTDLENQLLTYLSSNPFSLCTRTEIGDILYGRHRPTDRAIDILVTRLRKKLLRLSDVQPIRTEYRRGYIFEADVSAVPQDEPGSCDSVALRA